MMMREKRNLKRKQERGRGFSTFAAVLLFFLPRLFWPFFYLLPSGPPCFASLFFSFVETHPPFQQQLRPPSLVNRKKQTKKSKEKIQRRGRGQVFFSPSLLSRSLSLFFSSLCCLSRNTLAADFSLSLFTMDATAAARRLAAVNRHLGGGGEAAAAEKEQQHSSSSAMALPRSACPIAPSAVAAGARPAFRADRLLDGQASQKFSDPWREFEALKEGSGVRKSLRKEGRIRRLEDNGSIGALNLHLSTFFFSPLFFFTS